ncbi:hypothetical protein A9Q84_14745 [Halobacteriovorax marinus]|uniref:Uncharacterized protein n=1 Tax=Halobacteriovorax marinus TaxID=97084 RepID=A0A1Y5F521_9BACT|nr:hypothetical protein A9Q84_14745 [Halobacteriovorax marinus]
MSELTKEELTEKMHLQNRELLLKTDGLASLYIYNLENFAFRYLETSKNQGIKCQFEGSLFWVESIEPNILEALKWNNPELKSRLKDICKKHPGNQLKEIQISMVLETRNIDENTIECSARVLWQLPSGSKNIVIEKSVEFSFDDPVELRNKHPILLEEVCEIF